MDFNHFSSTATTAASFSVSATFSDTPKTPLQARKSTPLSDALPRIITRVKAACTTTVLITEI